MAIVGKRVQLRAIEAEDLDLLHQWANDERLWAGLGSWRFPSSMASVQAWFDGLAADTQTQRFAIQPIGETEIIGTANLVEFDWKNRHARHGMMLGPSERRGQGFGRDAVMAIMRYAFDELGLERLDGDIIEFNLASQRLYVGKCGWQEEGRQRRWHYRDGRFWDRILVGVTRDDYARLVHETGYWTNPLGIEQGAFLAVTK